MNINKIITINLIFLFSGFANAEFVLKIANECKDCEYILAPVVQEESTLLYEELTEQDVMDLQSVLNPSELDPDNDDYCNWNDSKSDCYNDFEWVKQRYERTSRITIDSQSDLIQPLRKLQLVNSITFKGSVIVPSYFKEWNLNFLNFENANSEFKNLNADDLMFLWFKNSSVTFDNDFNYTNVKSIYVSDSSDSTFPDLSNFVNIEEIDASRNIITDLPLNMSSLVNLKTLNISNNRFVNVPDVLTSLKSVEYLDISDNDIVDFDILLSDMNSLIHISIYSPSIQSFSTDFCNSWNAGDYMHEDRIPSNYIESFCI